LVRVPAADGQRTSSVTSGGQLAVLAALRSAPRRERLRAAVRRRARAAGLSFCPLRPSRLPPLMIRAFGAHCQQPTCASG
jgi:hypothetical protein